MLGDVPRFRIICGDRLGDFMATRPLFSLSGDGDDPPPDAELRRDEPILTSKCLNLNVTSFLVSSVLLNKKAKGHEIHDDSLDGRKRDENSEDYESSQRPYCGGD
jgi:hypothetical protein